MSVLRVATAGSVDDGKSTLIGRLLHDTKAIFDDQRRAVERASRRWGGDGLNLALLTDGLRAEREQGITIDVAHRYFATPRRSFVVADSPGHAQYTRNMVTAASNADVAVVLVDARHGVTDQTRRHAYIASMVGVGQIVLAVNKMDLVDWDQRRFDEITADVRRYLCARDPAPPITAIPVSALLGDNIVEPSASASWYTGPVLLDVLESADSRPQPDTGARLDVQWCIRHPPTDFRGVAGRLSGGRLAVGDAVIVAPSGTTTTVAAITRNGRHVSEADPRQAVTVVLAEQVDVTRGDVLVAADASHPPTTTTEAVADVCWMTETPLETGSRLLFKHGTRRGTATVTKICHRVDVATLQPIASKRLMLNDLARIELALSIPIVALPYRTDASAGRLVLIDPADHATAAAAMISEV
ncbi:MAG: sulfate adenylyltransferase subunit 1 [Ilumatobacteraceae bacterium]